MKRAFEKFAEYASIAMGSPWVFVLAISIIATWAASGPAAGYSEQWQLIINSFTTIVTFLMVFVIQNTQNRDFQALQLKLDALLLAGDGPMSSLASLHNVTEDELRRLERAMTKVAGKHNIDEIIRTIQKESKEKIEMGLMPPDNDETLIADALRSASHTRALTTRPGVRHEAAAAFEAEFGGREAIVVADQNTFAAAGRDVCASLERANRPMAAAFVFGPHVYADDRCVKELRQMLQASPAIPIAVGSGTINDLTKLAAYQTQRPYLVVATAASMDGYTAYGASITAQGSKQTFDCPAPQVVLADLEVIAAAPRGMNASGYADLLAKVPAGADWIVADALGVEPIDEPVWQTVQGRLKSWVGSPAEVARCEPTALKHLVNGLMLSGFAMQAARSSRPASGAEHQFSHLWDMEHHTHNGVAPSHGFKVGIGTLASVALYEELIRRDIESLDIENAVRRWPSLDQLVAQIDSLFTSAEIAEKAKEETAAKYVTAEALRNQLLLLQQVWPQLRFRLQEYLLPFVQLQSMLAQAGCPRSPEEIGISRPRLRRSYEQALFIRRRFTVLDLAHRAGLLNGCLDCLFGAEGAWRPR